MRKNYYSPATEVLTVNTAYGLCQAASPEQFGGFHNGGGAGGPGQETIDPSHGS